jgi:hypothetical protein
MAAMPTEDSSFRGFQESSEVRHRRWIDGGALTTFELLENLDFPSAEHFHHLVKSHITFTTLQSSQSLLASLQIMSFLFGGQKQPSTAERMAAVEAEMEATTDVFQRYEIFPSFNQS